MSLKARRIDDDTLAILGRMIIQGNVVLLYPAQLERDAYVKLNKVLEGLGGKWKRGKGHVFEGDPTDRIEGALSTGSYECPRLNDFFPTPAPIVDRMLGVACISRGMNILEPSAGDGAIADRIRERHEPPAGAMTLVELSPERAKVLQAKGHQPVLCQDFLTAPFVSGFDRIVMNPPFSRRQDVAHVRRAYDLLAPAGRLVSIMAAGIDFRQDRATTELRELILTNGDVESLPEGTFSEAGTEVRTVLVVLDKAAA
jgi:SAM-dependent methyltransferase